jgi:hypothetical protein
MCSILRALELCVNVDATSVLAICDNSDQSVTWRWEIQICSWEAKLVAWEDRRGSE